MGNQGSKLSSNTSIEEESKSNERPTESRDAMMMEVFNALPLKEKAALARTSRHYYGLFRRHLHAAKVLMLVAHGNEHAASEMLTPNPALLLESTDVTDYSGRTFQNITAYEYAYWAGDWHMCRMLESHMNLATKTQMAAKINAIEQKGLHYEQHGERKNSKHFDFTALKTAYQAFFEEHTIWLNSQFGNEARMNVEEKWLSIGVAQRDLPANVAQQFCRTDHSFESLSAIFDDPKLPRELTFSHYEHEFFRCGNGHQDKCWFPIVIEATTTFIEKILGQSYSAGLGFTFVITRGLNEVPEGWTTNYFYPYTEFDLADQAAIDYGAIIYLEEANSKQRIESCHNLKSSPISISSSERYLYYARS